MLGRHLARDHRADAPLPRGRTVALCILVLVACILALVAHRGTRHHVRPDVEQDFELAAIACLAPGQVEGERQATEVDLEMDPRSGRGQALVEKPPRECLVVLPPSCACRRDRRANDCGVEHLDQMRRAAHGGERVKEGLEHSRLAQSPEALPDTRERQARKISITIAQSSSIIRVGMAGPPQAGPYESLTR